MAGVPISAAPGGEGALAGEEALDPGDFTADPGSPSEPPPALRNVERRRRPRIVWARLPLPLTTIAAAAISLALFFQMVAMPTRQRDEFFIGNGLPPAARDALMHWVMAAVLLPLLAAGVGLFLARGKAVVVLERTALLVATLIPACLLPAIFSVRFSHQNQLTYLAVLAAFVLIFESLFRYSLGAVPTRMWEPVWTEVRALRRLPHPSPRVFFFALVCVASATYAAYVGFYTILNHHRLGTTAFDLGIYDNLMYNALHGRPFVSPVLFGPAGGNYLAGHAEFAMLLFVPFYAIHPGPETMLIIQAVVLGFAAVPLYLFASTRLTRPVAAALAIGYLMFAPLHGPNFYDFHWIPLALFFHFWLYYAIAQRKHWLTVAMVAVLFAIREDVAVGLAVLGLFLLFSGLRPRLGVLLAIASVTWFVIVRFVIMPLAGAWYFQNLYSGLFADGVASFGSVIKTIVTNPLYTFASLGSEAKLTYLGHMFIPLALLPCRRVQLLPLAVAGMFFTILTTGYGPTVQISFQYTTHWIPYLFLASTLALMMMSRQPNGAVARRAALATLAIAMLAHSYNFGALLQHEIFVGGFSKIEFKMSAEDRRRYGQLKELLAMIPRTASVAATEQETAHVSTRKVVYPLRVAPGPVDYLLIGRSHVGDLSRTALNTALANRSEYGLLAERGDELFLFKRGFVSEETNAARAKLGVP